MKKAERVMRNAEIMAKFNSGVKIRDLAKEYGMTYVGIYQILGKVKKTKLPEVAVTKEVVGEPIVEALLPEERVETKEA